MRKSIIERLILKGGLYGLTAKRFVNDEITSDKVIIECFEQCLNKSA